MAKEKIYLFDHSPHLRGEWDYEKNVGVDPESLPKSSRNKYWWVCPKNHSYQSVLGNRSKGHGCGICSGMYPDVGVNDLGTLYPELCKELLDPSSASSLMPKTNRKVEWVCPLGHRYPAVVANRVLGTGCTYCSNQKVLVGFNDLETIDPVLAAQVDDENVTAKMVAGFSTKKLWWKCADGHRWIASVSSRKNGRGCPYCSGKRPVVGETDLGTTHPTLCLELIDYSQKTKYTAGSDVKVAWKCAVGHSWVEQVSKRSKRGFGCPYCSNRRILVGFNDLATTHPELSSELFDPDILPTEVTSGSSKKARWRCDKGHVWSAAITSRSRGNGCSVCSTNQTSGAEGFLRELLRDTYPQTHLDHRKRLPVSNYIYATTSIDIHVELDLDVHLVVEYDGSYWHKNSQKRDVEKTHLLLDEGYLVVRIRETNKTVLDFLPISHENLLQLKTNFTKDYSNLSQIVKMITEWVTQREMKKYDHLV